VFPVSLLAGHNIIDGVGVQADPVPVLHHGPGEHYVPGEELRLPPQLHRSRLFKVPGTTG
jgi:hypothetical protein